MVASVRSIKKTQELKHKGTLGFVALGNMRVRQGITQRKYIESWAIQIAESFDIDKLGYPVVNKIGSHYWIVDGQHRVAGTRIWNGEGWETVQLECVIHKNLSEQEEADLFLSINFQKAVSAFEKFVIGLKAKREDETNINAIVKKNGMKVSKSNEEGCIACVGALIAVYRKSDVCLDRTLNILWNSFGDPGITSDLIKGIGLLVNRYDEELDVKLAISAFESMRGGSNALLTRAADMKNRLGHQISHCIAAAAVETINRATPKKKDKLIGWWKVSATDSK